MDAATLYDVLGAEPGADDEALRLAYRRRVRQTHPDRGGDADEFREVQSAWELLSDDEERRRYDEWLSRLSGAPDADEESPDGDPWDRDDDGALDDST